MRITAGSVPRSALVLLLVGAGPAATAAAPEADHLTPFESSALAALAALDRSDRADPAGGVWPGYRFSERPLLVYVPDRWAVLLHSTKAPADFLPYPAAWPAAGPPAALHRGRFENLVGQLVFDLPLNGGPAAAIPLAPALFSTAVDSAAVACLTFVAHEAFHQYQHDRFASVETGSEERYPIEDAENAALVAVEMQALSEALLAAEHGDWQAMRSSVEGFLAVRAHRWRRASVQTVELERQQELVEGTAKYVEARAVALVARRCAADPADSLQGAICARLAKVSAAGYVREELARRLQRNAVEIGDLPRNRVYGVGAAQGILLDALGVDWKRFAQDSAETFTCGRLLESAMGRERPTAAEGLAHVLRRHGYAALLRTSHARIGEYRASYRAARAEFEAQTGLRVGVTLSTRHLSRSRSSSARR